MTIKQGLSEQYLTLPLIILMALTRSNHFGDAFFLPDASLAVFFLAGFAFARRWGLVILLLLEAVLIDYLAITQFNVSSFCVSPAYLFLLPTYGVMWYAGMYCTRFKNLAINDMGLSIVIMTIATSIAFFISNSSFYLLSGRVAQFSWAQYIDGIEHYYPHYLSSTLCYGVLSLIIIKLFKALAALMTHRTI